jgi:hypothetical protein
VIEEAASIEHHPLDTGIAGALGHELTDAPRGVLVGRAAAPQVALERRCRHQGAAGTVVDDLGGDVLVGAEDGEARPLSGAPHVLAYPGVPLDAGVSLVLGAVHHLPALPALRWTYSPAYRTPLPL